MRERGGAERKLLGQVGRNGSRNDAPWHSTPWNHLTLQSRVMNCITAGHKIELPATMGETFGDALESAIKFPARR